MKARVGFWQRQYRPGLWLGGFRLLGLVLAVGTIDDVLCVYIGLDALGTVGLYFGSRFEPVHVKRVGGFYRLAVGPLAVAVGQHA